MRGPGGRAGILPKGTLSPSRKTLAQKASYMFLLNFSNNYFNIFISSLGGGPWNWSDVNCGSKETFFFFFLNRNLNPFGLGG